MLKKIILYFFGFSILAGSILSCDLITGPDFPDNPKIYFKSIEKRRIQDRLGNATDSVNIAVKFEDGDGDLGIAAEEIGNPPFHRQDSVPDGQGGYIKTPNRLYYNYYVQSYRKTNGVFIPFENVPTLNGQYPPLNEGKKGPIEGTLYYGTLFPILLTPPNDTLRFDVYILDRAGNTSNVVSTSEVIVNQR
jgi:hypothetical protein